MDERELDALRQTMIDMAPGLRADVNAMTHIFREMVALERKKMGLDQPEGALYLSALTEKKDPSGADFAGSGKVAGRSYRARAWLSQGKLKISLLPQKRK